MKNKIKNISLIIATMALFSSCVNDTYNDPTQAECVNPGITKTKEVSDIYALATNATQIYHHLGTDGTEIPEYIEGVVISSDEGGNFYKRIYIEPLDGSRGIYLSVDEVNSYTKSFQPGRKIFVKLNGLAFANPTSYDRALTIGAPPTAQYAVDRLAGTEYKKYLIPSCDFLSEDTYVKKLTLSQAMNDANLNTLVEIQDVQFQSFCSTYSKSTADTSLKITNGTQNLDLRTSSFASFAGDPVPTGRGTIRGVLTKYNSGYQIIIRNKKDVNLNGPRIEVPTPVLGGTAVQYLGSFNEGFESYAVGTNVAFPKYFNDAVIGTKYWDIATFSNNKYLQISAYNNGCVKSYLIIPVDMTAAKTFSFKSKDGYNDGDPLKVFYSTDYTPGGDITQATLVDITSKFAISTGNKTGYATNFTNSGNFSIPDTITGNGYFIFEYDGTTGITTTMQIDDVSVQ